MSAQLLSDWCTRNCFIVDPRIRICYNEIQGIHVVSRDEPIPIGTTLVRIPKDVVLSVKSCSLSEHIPFELHGLGAQLGLSFALYSEILRGGSSRWSGYLRSLSQVDLPAFWGSDPPKRPNGVPIVPDHDDPLLWLRGTEVQKLLNKRDDDDRTLADSVDYYYHEVVEQTLRRPDVQRFLDHEPELTSFRQAYSLVSSRAFLLDTFHGLAMTPVADAFNHVLENHVHIESDFYVCPECGSLAECTHDHEERDDITSARGRPGDSDLYYDMVSGREIQPHEEVFNTYGAKLCNAQLLMRYGFTLDPNDNDTINFDLEEIVSSLPFSQGAKEIPHLDDAVFASLADTIADSNLICVHDSSNNQAPLCINSDGKISHQLWLLLIELVIRDSPLTRPPTELRGPQLQEVIATQINLEESLQEDRPSSMKDRAGERDSMSLHLVPVLLGVGCAIIKLCEKKKKAIGLPGFADKDLGGILDVIPGDNKRLREALFIVICERSIVDSCKFGWVDFVDNT